MAAVTITLNSAAVPSSPITRTVTFNDGDLQDILAAFKQYLRDPSLTAGGVVSYFSKQIAEQVRNVTQNYLINQQNPQPPAPPDVSES